MRTLDQIIAAQRSPEELERLLDARTCTCHPSDNPPAPCPRRFALTDCRLASIPAPPDAPGEEAAARRDRT